MYLLEPMSSQKYNTYIKDKIVRYAITLQENTYEATNEVFSFKAEKAIKWIFTKGF